MKHDLILIVVIFWIPRKAKNETDFEADDADRQLCKTTSTSAPFFGIELGIVLCRTFKD